MWWHVSQPATNIGYVFPAQLKRDQQTVTGASKERIRAEKLAAVQLDLFGTLIG